MSRRMGDLATAHARRSACRWPEFVSRPRRPSPGCGGFLIRAPSAPVIQMPVASSIASHSGCHQQRAFGPLHWLRHNGASPPINGSPQAPGPTPGPSGGAASLPPLRGCGPGPRGAAARGPGAHKGPHPVRNGAALRLPHTLCCMRGGGLRPPFLRTPRPLLPRGPCPWAGPLRRAAPAAASLPRSGAQRPPFASLRSPGPPPRPCPPAPPLGRLCAAARLRGRSLAALRLGSPSLRCGLPVRSPLLRLRFASALRVAPPGPPGPVRFAASGAVGSGPGACAALRAACSGLSAPGPWLRGRACASLLRFAVGAAVVVGFSPASPPPLPPPLGAPGGREASGLGGSRPRRCAPPPVVQVLPVVRPPLVHCPPRVKAALRRAPPGLDPVRAFFVRRALTFPACCATLFWRGPSCSFGGCPSRGIHRRQ